MADLSLEVRGQDIVVSKPGAGFAVTYRKDPMSPVLVAQDPLRQFDTEKLKFLVQAWNAAFAKAKRAQLALASAIGASIR